MHCYSPLGFVCTQATPGLCTTASIQFNEPNNVFGVLETGSGDREKEESEWSCNLLGSYHLLPSNIIGGLASCHMGSHFSKGAQSTSSSIGLESISVLDQIYGTLYGQCIGDAIGLLTEFMVKKDAKLVGNLPYRLNFRIPTPH